MSSTADWYRSLRKPGWAPAENVFGQVWSVLYVIIALANIFVLIEVLARRLGWQTGLPFWLNLGFNLIYTPIQFGLRNNLLALVDILLVLATIIWSMIAVWPHHKWVAVAYAPYLVWVCIATALQTSITWLNR